MKHLWRRLATVALSVGVLFGATAGIALAGAGSCDPGRASETINRYVTVTKTASSGNGIDEVRATFLDNGPYVEGGVSEAQVNLYRSSTGLQMAQFGYHITKAGDFHVFAKAWDSNSNLVFSRDDPASWYDTIFENGNLNGSGGDDHKFTINRVNSFGSQGFEFLIDGNNPNGWFATMDTGNLWTPTRAQVVLDTENRGSQFWGRQSYTMQARNIEYAYLPDEPAAHDGFVLDDHFDIVGATLYTISGQGLTLRAWDNDCP